MPKGGGSRDRWEGRGGKRERGGISENTEEEERGEKNKR
jgi:hypothetical protein